MFIIKVGVKHPGQTEGLTDDVVTELVKTVEAREKYASPITRTTRRSMPPISRMAYRR